MKKIVIILIGISVLGIITVVAVRLLSPEDDWVCEGGSWKKHGNPSTPKPTELCLTKVK